jgi:hypothetical protein
VFYRDPHRQHDRLRIDMFLSGCGADRSARRLREVQTDTAQGNLP